MRLRKLETKDAQRMLEWMHDKSVVENLRTNFENKTLADCIEFIEKSGTEKESVNLAIVSDDDEYMGTVSLKDIDDEKAEFAITVRSDAMGKGYSPYAMNEIIQLGFRQLGISEIYWCVDKRNARAVRFYEKNGWKSIDIYSDPLYAYLKKKGSYTESQIDHFQWFMARSYAERNQR